MTDDIALELYPPEYCLSDVIQQQSIRANPTLEPTVLLSFVFISWALTYDKYPRRWTCMCTEFAKESGQVPKCIVSKRARPDSAIYQKITAIDSYRLTIGVLVARQH